VRGLLLERNDLFVRPKKPQVRPDPPPTVTTARRGPNAARRQDEVPLDAARRNAVLQGATTAPQHRRATSVRIRGATPAPPRERSELLVRATRHGDSVTTTLAPRARIERVRRRRNDVQDLVRATRHGDSVTTTLTPRVRIERVRRRRHDVQDLVRATRHGDSVTTTLTPRVRIERVRRRRHDVQDLGRRQIVRRNSREIVSPGR
jgi:hypothetical protein